MVISIRDRFTWRNLIPWSTTFRVAFWSSIVIMCVARVWLSYSWGVNAMWWATADDSLLIREAIGDTPADDLTMSKRPGFSFLLRLFHASHIPYTIIVALVWIIVAAVFAWSIHLLNGSLLAVWVSFILALWCPMGFDGEIGLRVYRGSILSPALLLCVASMIAMFASCVWWERILWASITGLSAGWLWLAKEDSSWIIPMLLVAVIATAIRVMMSSHRRVAVILVLLPAILIPVAGDLACRWRNERNWGVSMLDTRTEGALAGFVERLYRIESPNRTYKRWTTNDAIHVAIRVDPELKPLEPYLMNGYYRTIMGDDKGIYGDYITWELRSSILQANNNRWPGESALQDQFSRANHLLDEAVTRGEYRYDMRFSPSKLAAPIGWNDIRERVLPRIMPVLFQSIWPTQWTAPYHDTQPVNNANEASWKAEFLSYINESERPQRYVRVATWAMEGWRLLTIICIAFSLAGVVLGIKRRQYGAFLSLAFLTYALIYIAAESWFLVFRDGLGKGTGLYMYVDSNVMPLMITAIGLALSCLHASKQEELQRPRHRR